jgi:hypothetical protein
MPDVKPRVKARYFCEACGAEVRAGASTCPSCGAVFTAVRCPECGYEGRAPEFHAGCPVCGYREKTREGTSTDHPSAPARKPGLPAAFYRIAAIVLTAIILGLVVLLVLHG